MQLHFLPYLVPATQRCAVPAAGGTRLAHETDKTQSQEKSQFDGVNPAVRVHAVGGVLWLVICDLGIIIMQ